MKKTNKETEEKIIDLYINQKRNSTDIANELNISFNTVLRIVKRNGLTTRKSKDVIRGVKRKKCVDVVRVIDLYTNENRSSAYISNELGCSDVTILNILKEHNISKKNNSFYLKKYFDEQKATELYNNGYSIDKIAKELNSSSYCVGSFFRKNGLNKPENKQLLAKGKIMSKEAREQMGITKRNNKENGLYDHIYLKRTGLTYAEFQKQQPVFKAYWEQVRIQTNKQPINTLTNFDKRGKSGVDGAYQLDHKYSIIEGFKNKIDPKIIGHISNLEMLSWEENLRKQGECSITLKELKKTYNLIEKLPISSL